MKSFIIGIAGQKNSGKDTVASMISYITNVGIAKANYQEWITKKAIYDLKFKNHIIHFADSLKDCISIMYGIKRRYFDIRDYKDNQWYCFKSRRFITYQEAVEGKYHIIEMNDLYNQSLREIISEAKADCVIQLRTLLKYIGTDICRNYLDDNIWVTSTMLKAHAIADESNYCIIADVRFANEANAIMKSSLYGGVIVINRHNDDEIDHPSETIDFEGKYYIDNNGSKLQLFYKVLQIMQNI